MERSYPVVFLIIFAIVTIGTLLVAASVSGVAFGTYNLAWDGTSELRSIAHDLDSETDIVRDTEYYRSVDAEDTVVFILSPDTAYTTRESAAIREFAVRGGTVVIAGDFGVAANQLLDDIGVASRLHGAIVRDEEHFDGGPVLPVATNITNHTYTVAVDDMTLNHATVLRTNASDREVKHLINTSSFAYLDTNRNAQLDETETLREQTVVSVEEVGRGQVITVSDPSVFINAMLEHEGNRQFVTNILAAHDRAAVDVSHAGGLPPLAWFVVTVRDSPFLQVIGGITLIIGIVTSRRIAAQARMLGEQLMQPTPDPPQVDREELIASLQHLYPQWEEQRLHRVAEAVINHEEISHDD